MLDVRGQYCQDLGISMIPTTGKNCKKTHEERRTCPGWFNVELYNKTYFPLRIFSAAMVTVKMSFTHFHSCIGNILLHQTMQPISLNYNWDNGVKQIKITAENLWQSCILCQLLRAKTPASGSKCIQHFFYFYHYLPYIRWVEEWMWFI